MKARKGKGDFVCLKKISRATLLSLNLEWKTKCVSVIMERVKMVWKIMMGVAMVRWGNVVEVTVMITVEMVVGAERQWWWIR